MTTDPNRPSDPMPPNPNDPMSPNPSDPMSPNPNDPMSPSGPPPINPPTPAPTTPPPVAAGDPYAQPPAGGAGPADHPLAAPGYTAPATGTGSTGSSTGTSAGSVSLDRSKLSTYDQGLAGAAVLFFIALLLPWASFSVQAAGLPGSDNSDSTNGFSSGLLTLAWVLLIAAAVLALLPAFGANVNLPFPRSLALLGLTGLAALITLFAFIDALTAPDDIGQAEALGLDVSYSAGIGAYLGMLTALAAVALAFLVFRSDQTARVTT